SAAVFPTFKYCNSFTKEGLSLALFYLFMFLSHIRKSLYLIIKFISYHKFLRIV
ncbi:hypothetical protein L9F63_006213, partial [Diploptera punctata]